MTSFYVLRCVRLCALGWSTIGPSLRIQSASLSVPVTPPHLSQRPYPQVSSSKIEPLSLFLTPSVTTDKPPVQMNSLNIVVVVRMYLPYPYFFQYRPWQEILGQLQVLAFLPLSMLNSFKVTKPDFRNYPIFCITYKSDQAPFSPSGPPPPSFIATCWSTFSSQESAFNCSIFCLSSSFNNETSQPPPTSVKSSSHFLRTKGFPIVFSPHVTISTLSPVVQDGRTVHLTTAYRLSPPHQVFVCHSLHASWAIS